LKKRGRELTGADGSKIAGAALGARGAGVEASPPAAKPGGADGSTVGSAGFGPCADVAQTIAKANNKPNNASGVPIDRLMIGSP
jgi:hypothetical protein